MSINGAKAPIVGVITVPARAVHIDIKAQVAKVLEGVAVGETMAVLNVQTGTGINIAVAHRFNEEWQVDLYVGKSGWDRPIAGGVTVAFSR